MNRALFTLVAACLLGVTVVGGLAPTRVSAQPATTSGDAQTLAQAHDRAVVDLLLIEKRLATTEHDLATAQAASERIDAQLVQTTAAAERAASDLRTAQQRFSTRVRQSYMGGHYGWLDAVIGSADLTQLLSRVDFVNRILGQSARMVDNVQTAKEYAATTRTKLEADKKAQTVTVAELRSLKGELTSARDDQAALATSLGAELAAVQAAARAAQARMDAINAQSATGTQPARGDGTTRTTGKATTATTKKSGGSTGTTKQGTTTDNGARPGGRQLKVKVTAYCDSGTTASGVPTGPGIIAVDPRVIKLGTRVYVPGYGEALAADTGGVIKGNFIDIWLPDYQTALDFGIQYRTITVYD
jgi:3D (Asp-Asp-Asp) domain-containing protein/peptidoglycan hydrolase CwlO-like protein